MKISSDYIIKNAFKIGRPSIEPFVSRRMKESLRSEYKARTSMTSKVESCKASIKEKIMFLFEKHEILTRNDVATILKIPLATVLLAFSDLQKNNLIETYDPYNKDRTGELRSYIKKKFD